MPLLIVSLLSSSEVFFCYTIRRITDEQAQTLLRAYAENKGVHGDEYCWLVKDSSSPPFGTHLVIYYLFHNKFEGTRVCQVRKMNKIHWQVFSLVYSMYARVRARVCMSEWV